MKDQGLLIVGTGAMACLFAARLAAAGVSITMWGRWADGVAALRRHGVRILEMDGSEHTFPVRVVDDPDELGVISDALVLVKSWQTERAALGLVKKLSADGLAISLQNGLGNGEILADHLGSERVAVGTMTLGAYLTEPVKVCPTWEGMISLGMHPRINRLESMLREAGFAVQKLADITSLLWGKLVINAAINPLTALLQVLNGKLLDRPVIQELFLAAACEAAAVAAAQGINLPYPDPVLAVTEIARRTATNRSSMLQDLLRGTPSEIDVINGAIVQAGERAGVPTPVNQILWQLVRAAEESKQDTI